MTDTSCVDDDEDDYLWSATHHLTPPSTQKQQQVPYIHAPCVTLCHSGIPRGP